jgi:hypothetical protein
MVEVNSADALREPRRFPGGVCNAKRMHSALGYLTWAEFEEQWRAKPSAFAMALSGLIAWARCNHVAT